MARTAVTPAQGVRNGGVAPTATTINSTLVTNGVVIAGADPDKLLIRVTNSDTGGAHPLTVRAGDSLTPAWMKGQGDLAVSVAASGGVEDLVGVDSARFLQSDGSLLLDFGTGFTGTLETIYRP